MNPWWLLLIPVAATAGYALGALMAANTGVDRDTEMFDLGWDACEAQQMLDRPNHHRGVYCRPDANCQLCDLLRAGTN